MIPVSYTHLDVYKRQVQYVGATGGVTDKAIVDKMLAKYREDYK